MCRGYVAAFENKFKFPIIHFSSSFEYYFFFAQNITRFCIARCQKEVEIRNKKKPAIYLQYAGRNFTAIYTKR